VYEDHYFVLITFVSYDNYSEPGCRLNHAYRSGSRKFSSYCSPNYGLDPWFIVGLVDGDGCFYYTVTINAEGKLRSLQLFFTINAFNSPTNLAMLQKIQKVLGGIIAYTVGGRFIRLQITGIKD